MKQHPIPIKKLISNKQPSLISSTVKFKKAKRTPPTHKYAMRTYFSSLLCTSPWAKGQFIYLLPRGTVKKKHAKIRPVIKSTKAKATMKYIADVTRTSTGLEPVTSANTGAMLYQLSHEATHLLRYSRRSRARIPLNP